MLRTALQCSIIGIGLIATYHLASAGLGLTPDLILQLGKTKLGCNPDILNSLARQRADTSVGWILFLVTIVFQLFYFIIDSRRPASPPDWRGAAIGLGVCIVVAIGAQLAAASEGRSTRLAIDALVEEGCVTPWKSTP